MNHGVHPHMNLWEGNVGNELGADFIHGSSSHNTVYRSVSSGYQTPRMPGQVPYNYNAVDLEYKNTYTSFIGNVLGTTGQTNTYEVAYPANDDAGKLMVWHFGYGAPDPSISPFDPMARRRRRTRRFDMATGKLAPQAGPRRARTHPRGQWMESSGIRRSRRTIYRRRST